MNTEIETLKKEFDILQTTILPKEKLEDTMVAANIDQWIEFIENYETDPLTPNEYICDYTIMKNAKAFALGPVFSYMGKVEACSTYEYNSLKDLKVYLNGKKYIVYCIMASIKAERVGTVDNGTYTIIPNRPLFGTPEIRYVFRGHILNDT